MMRRIDDRWFLPAEGLVSGLMTCLLLHLSYAFEFLGLTFGAVLAAHVCVFRGVRSPFLLIGFIATCGVAYLLSMAVPGVFLNLSTSGTLESRIVFPAGVLGAATICAGVFFFLQPPKEKGKFLLRALCISAACGFLGVLGWSIGQRLQGVPSRLPGMPLPPPDNRTLCLLFITWQTGTASLLGLLLSEQGSLAGPASAARPEAVSLRTETRRGIGSASTIVPFVLVLLAGTWLVAPEVRNDLAAHHIRVVEEAAQRRLAAERPSSQNLPPIVPLPVESVLLLQPIDGHPCVDGFEAFPRADHLAYLAGYARSEGVPPGAPAFVSVEVRLYASPAWAVYATKEFEWDSAAQNPKVVTTVTRFGNRVIMNTLMQDAKGGGQLYFYWASGSRFVWVTFRALEDDEFLKEYLGRYPSTL